MIPKILHRCFLGTWDWTPTNRRCHESWLKYLPDFQMMFWGPDNLPDIPWLHEAYRVKPVNAVSYLRYWTLWQFGGIGMDNDMEIINPIDDCLQHGAFVGFQKEDSEYMCLNYSIIGAEKGHPWLREMLDIMEHGNPNDSPLRWCNILLGETMKARGMVGLNEQKVGDIMLYAKEVFFPRWHTESPESLKITDRTLAVHHWEHSWRETP